MLTPEEQTREPMKKVKKAKLEQINQVVCGYLQRRNYPNPLDANKTSSLSAKEFMVSALINNDISRPNSILYSCLNNDPTMMDQTFTKFVSWLKDLVNNQTGYDDLEKLTGPLLCHFYFEILRGGHTERATNFYKYHLPVIDKNKCDAIVINLLNAFSKESAADLFSLKDDFRSSKYTVQLSTDSVNILRKFLEEVHIVLLHVLQNWFTIEELVEQEEEEDSMEVDNCDMVDSVDINNCGPSNKSAKIQELLDIMNAVKSKPKSIYCVNIKNVKDEISCGVFGREHTLMAYSYNNCIYVRSLETLQQLRTTLLYGEMILVGHSGRIYDMAIFNNYLISGSQDRTIRLYDLIERSEEMVYYGHDYPIYCLCVSQNNEFFASGSYDKTARLWSISRKDNLRLFIGHTQEVTSIDFHPNSNYIISGAADKNIKMWAISNAEPVRSFPGSTGNVYSVRFSPDGKYLFSTGEDAKLRIWDLQAGKELISLQIGEECCTKIAVNSDESHVAVASVDGIIKTWDFKKLINELVVKEPLQQVTLRPRILNLDYCSGTFGCLSSYRKSIKPNKSEEVFDS